MKINAERLSKLRQWRKIPLSELARRANLSSRQIQRLESEQTTSKATRESTLMKLAKALDVEPGVLTGQLPDPTSEELPRSDEMERVSISAKITPSAHLAFAFIKRRYGVNLTTIVNMAPLFFTLLAEGSLKWRHEKLSEVSETINKLGIIGGDAGHLAFTNAAWRIDEAATEEQRSIDKVDIFGEEISEAAYDLGFRPSESNPFADYLRKLAKELDNGGVVEIDPGGDKSLDWGVSWNFPDYVVCRDELDTLTGGSDTAKFALQTGDVRLADIPEELLAEEATDERVKWLEARAPSLDELLDGFEGEDA